MSTRKTFDASEMDDRKQRQKDQFVLSLLIVTFLVASWAAGSFASVLVSSLVCVLLILLVFTIWWRKSAHLLEKSIKAEELKVHKKKALRSEETAEWINFILNRWWNFSEASLFQVFKTSLDPVFELSKPSFIDSMEIVEFTFGGCTPCVKYIKSFDGSRNKPSRAGLCANDVDLEELGSHLLVLDLDLLMSAPDTSVVIRVRLGGKFVGAEVDVAVEDVSISGRLQVVIHLNHKAPFPHMKGVSISFLEKPDVDFDVRMLKALRVMDIPMVKDFINSLVMDSLTIALVDPEQIYVPLFEIEGEEISRAVCSSYAVGVLTLTITGGDQDSSDDVVWLTVKLGDQERTFERKPSDVHAKKSITFLVYDLKNEKCTVEIKGKRSLGTKFTIAKHKISLKKLDLENNPETDHTHFLLFNYYNQVLNEISKPIENKRKWVWSTVLEKAGVKGSRLEIDLVYTTLQPVDVQHQTKDEFLEKYGFNDDPHQVSGILLVILHSGSKLLPMDSDGFSDPYCIVTVNKQGIKTTEHVPNSINPVWDSLVEFPVNDISKITLSFLVYDRDNNWQSKSDDFMGSCNLSFSLEDKVVIRQELELRYKVFGGRNSEDTVMKAGSLCVSLVFRPVETVALSEHFTSSSGVNDGEDLPGVNVNGKPHTSKTLSKTRKQVEEMLLLRERGALVVSILQARNLVAMDNNGLSDPFCIVLVEEEKKYKTKVIDETLEPNWDETFSLPMLAELESLNINIYDKDVIKKEFMGKVSLSVTEILQLAQDENPVWFPLVDTESGEIQLSFKVNSSDRQLESLTEAERENSDRAGSGSNKVSKNSLDEEHETKMPDVLSQISGELIQAEDLLDDHPVTVIIKLEKPRKNKRPSLRSKAGDLQELIKTDPVTPVDGRIEWNASFQASDKATFPKETLLSIELKTNNKKSSSKTSPSIQDLMQGELENARGNETYTVTKWLTMDSSDKKTVGKLQLMLTFSANTDFEKTEPTSNSGKKNRRSFK